VEYVVGTAGDGEISFSPTVAGIHNVSVAATDGGAACKGDSERLNVKAPGARSRTFRIRVVPPPGHPAPMQEMLQTVFGGSDYYLGTLALDPGYTDTGEIFGPDHATGTAYVRATLTDSVGPLVVEAFADEAGEFTIRVPQSGTWDRLVVPSLPGVAPEMRRGLTSGQLAEAVLLTAGSAINGSVVDSSGSPVAGATVSLVIDGAPSTLGVTSAAGTFSLRARPGESARVTIDPPPASGLPRLGTVLDSIGTSTPLVIAFSPSIGSRAHSFDVEAAAGGPAAGARVTFTAREIGGAGTVETNGDAVSATGTSRTSTTASGTGHVDALILPDALYDVVIESATIGQAPALAVVDLRSGAGAVGTLSLTPGGTVTGHVRTPSGAPVAGARISARGVGLLANMPAASATVQSGSDGDFTLSVAPGGSYVIAIVPGPASGLAPAAVDATAPDAGNSFTLAPAVLAPTINVVGEVSVPGLAGAAAGVHLILTCATCSDTDPPLAQTTTDAAGRFVLRAPDPGTD
jgi:hypothetical protein